jgi:hypothetical protein
MASVLDSIKENNFYGGFEAWKSDGTAVYVSKGTILKEMVAKLRQHFFFDLFQELSDTTSYVILSDFQLLTKGSELQ